MSDAAGIRPAPTRAGLAGPTGLLGVLCVMVVLVAAGAPLGLVWALWSPPGPQAEILHPGVYAVLGESESQVAADGRFLVIVAAAGLIASVGAWFGLRAHRGAGMGLLLCLGGAGGAALTALVGHLTGGGSDSGRIYQLSDGTRGEVTLRLPLSLHMPALIAAEPAVIALVYGLLAGFHAHDDLGRPDPCGDEVRAGRARRRAAGYEREPGGSSATDLTFASASVHPGAEPQDRRGDGDAAGPSQQREFPPQ